MALETAANYPVYFAVTEDNKIARWRPFVQFLMAIPHFIVAMFIGIAAAVCIVISWFAILFTGNMPEGLANFIIMAQRYNARVGGFAALLTEQYPPFEFQQTAADPGDYAIRLDVRPALTGRNRLTVFFRYFTQIPIQIFAFVVFIGVYVVMFIAWFAIIFTGQFPQGMRDFVIKGLRLNQRASGYASLLTDEYPPFQLQ